MDTLDATLSRVIYHKPPKHNPNGTPFLIASTECGKVVKGTLKKPRMSVPYRFWGGWKPGNDGALAFHFETADEVVGVDARSIARYLARNVPDIGPARSARVVDVLGLDCLTKLRENPELIFQVGGMPDSAAESLAQFFEDNPADPAAYAALVELFDGQRVPRKVIDRLMKDHGAGAAKWALEHPYALRRYPRMGWKTVDSFALQRAGVSRLDLYRQVAAIVEGITQLSRDGHTIVGTGQADFAAAMLIGAQPTKEAWDLVVTEVEHMDDRLGGVEGVGLSRLLGAERRIAKLLALLSSYLCDDRVVMPEEAFVGMNEEQSAALRMLALYPVSILIGGPGTGKTYTLSRFLKYMPDGARLSTHCAAPTGKAAKRIAELIHDNGVHGRVESSTVHRMLGYVAASDRDDELDGSWHHGPGNFLPFSTIIIDEMSMLDAPLFASVLDAIAPGTRLILVGDPNQLPAVGPGAVLRDLLESDIPRVKLTEVRRNAGRIVRFCHSIQTGEAVEASRKLDLAEGENWAHIEASSGEEIADKIIEQIGRFKTFDRMWDVQVVSAQRQRLPFACDALNQRLSLLLNPLASADSEDHGDFAVGDKVVRTKNGTGTRMIPVGYDGEFDWSTGKFEGENLKATLHFGGVGYAEEEDSVVNGDMGEVLAILPATEVPRRPARVIVRFRWPDRLIWFPFDECHLERAYAMTVHKCQGSGFPVVIVPVHSGFYWDSKQQRGLWCRELVYTAFSRAEKLLVTVGSLHAVREAASRVTIHQRKTTLAARFRAQALIDEL